MNQVSDPNFSSLTDQSTIYINLSINLLWTPDIDDTTCGTQEIYDLASYVCKAKSITLDAVSARGV